MVYPHGISLGYIIIILAANEVQGIPGTLICDHRNDDKNRIRPVNGGVQYLPEKTIEIVMSKHLKVTASLRCV